MKKDINRQYIDEFKEAIKLLENIVKTLKDDPINCSDNILLTPRNDMIVKVREQVLKIIVADRDYQKNCLAWEIKDLADKIKKGAQWQNNKSLQELAKAMTQEAEKI